MLEAFNYYFSQADGNKGHPLLTNSYMYAKKLGSHASNIFFCFFFFNPAVAPKREGKLATTKFNPESGILWAAIFQYFV